MRLIRTIKQGRREARGKWLADNPIGSRDSGEWLNYLIEPFSIALVVPRVVPMSEIVEKRTIKILPSKIEKKLIQDIGELLENNSPMLGDMSYHLESKSRDIYSAKVNDFIRADWGKEISRITLGTARRLTRPEKSINIDITINFAYPENSDISVSGKDGILVNGISSEIENLFSKYRLNYYMVKRNIFIKYPLTFITSVVLTYPISLFLKDIGLWTSLFVLVGIGIHALIQWLFPYFEYDDPLQKKVRKWVWILLYGSGIIPTVILKLLGL